MVLLAKRVPKKEVSLCAPNFGQLAPKRVLRCKKLVYDEPRTFKGTSPTCNLGSVCQEELGKYVLCQEISYESRTCLDQNEVQLASCVDGVDDLLRRQHTILFPCDDPLE